MDVGGEWELAAVSDWVNYPLNDIGNTGAARVSLHNDWIDQTMQSVPEPNSILLIGFAILTIFGSKRHQRRRHPSLRPSLLNEFQN